MSEVKKRKKKSQKQILMERTEYKLRPLLKLAFWVKQERHEVKRKEKQLIEQRRQNLLHLVKRKDGTKVWVDKPPKTNLKKANNPKYNPDIFIDKATVTEKWENEPRSEE